MTTNLHDKMLAAIDAYFSASNEIEAHIAEEQLLDVRAEINKYKLAAESLSEGLRLDDWDKIGCVNHDCGKCKALAEQPAQQDIPDLIAGALGVSRGTAYDMMREALAEQPAQEPVAWISVKDALPKAVRGASYNASLTDVVLVRHSDRPDYPITAHAVIGEGLGAGIAIPTNGASEHPEIAWYSASSNLNNPFDLKNDDYGRYLPKVFGSKITHWKPIEPAPQAQPAQQEPVAEVKAKMTGGNVGIATVIHEIHSPLREPLQPGDKLYPAYRWIGWDVEQVWSERIFGVDMRFENMLDAIAFRKKLEEATTPQAQQAPDYAWPTIEDYEKEVGFKVNEAFKAAWTMARTTNDLFKQMGSDT